MRKLLLLLTIGMLYTAQAQEITYKGGSVNIQEDGYEMITVRLNNNKFVWDNLLFVHDHLDGDATKIRLKKKTTLSDGDKKIKGNKIKSGNYRIIVRYLKKYGYVLVDESSEQGASVKSTRGNVSENYFGGLDINSTSTTTPGMTWYTYTFVRADLVDEY